MNQHRESAENAFDIRTEFPIHSDTVEPGTQSFIALTESSPRAGVLLSYGEQRSEGKPWLRAELDDEMKNIRLELLVPSRRHLGKAALMDTILLQPDDQYGIGRSKYANLPSEVSRHHASFAARLGRDGIDLSVKDLRSANGTSIFIQEPRAYYREQQPTESNDFDAQASSEPTPAERLMSRHPEACSVLSEADWEFCVHVLTDLKRHADGDQKSLERRFNKVMHPDRLPGISQRIASAMYHIVRSELSL